MCATIFVESVRMSKDKVLFRHVGYKLVAALTYSVFRNDDQVLELLDGEGIIEENMEDDSARSDHIARVSLSSNAT